MPSGLALRYALRHPERVAGLVYVSGTGIDADATWKPDYHRNLHSGLGEDLARWRELEGRAARTPAEERELCVLQWSADFADADRVRARAHAERKATPWRRVNFEANRALGAELRDQDLARLRSACAELTVPALLVDGALDLRPRTAVDSLAEVLPDAGDHRPGATAPGFTTAPAASVRP